MGLIRTCLASLLCGSQRSQVITCDTQQYYSRHFSEVNGRHGSENKGNSESGQNKSKACSYILKHRDYNPLFVANLISKRTTLCSLLALLTYLSLSLVDRWGTKDDQATTVLHSSLFSAFRRTSPSFNPVHSVTLSSHLFVCLPLLLPPCTVPCRIIFASPVDL